MKMQQYRNRLKRISDVLSVALSSGGEGGASPSQLMRRSNLSYRGLDQLLSQLLSAGLIIQERGEGREVRRQRKGLRVPGALPPIRELRPVLRAEPVAALTAESGFQIRHSFRMVNGSCNN